ncbi:MAG: phosphate/phosphite/phosphonate ABC transporter substrate-binding protein [Chloroflexi bacterium]|nr:phosphate/phosphite/phosphonate ABC transporter substrate-binding protein [Chloroflexota bacterium]
MRRTDLLLLGLIAALFVGAMVLLVNAYGEGSPKGDVALSFSDLVQQRKGSDSASDPSLFRFAVAPVMSPRATLENYHALAAYIGKRLGRPVELVQGKSYAEINALVRSGDVSLAWVCSGAYVIGRREFGMQALAVPVVNGDKTYRSYLIVPSSSTARTWEDLRRKTFAFTDPLSNTGRLVPVYVLYKMGETPQRFFKDFIFTYSHDKSVEAVAEGLVDAAAVDSLVYDFLVRQDPSVGAKTKVIWESPAFGINPLVVHPNASPELRRQLESILLSMSADPAGRALLAPLEIDTFVKPEPHDYDAIEAMVQITDSQ